MAIKAADQITITDLTDAYSVILTSEAFTFVGGTGGATSGSCSTQVAAFCGSNQCTNVTIGSITYPDEIEGTVSGSGTSSPSITFSIKSGKTLSQSREIEIPVTITNGSDVIVFNKKFSIAVAKTGATGTAGKTWGSGTAITGTASTGNTGYAGKVGDQYLNTSTWNLYTCATEGTATTAKWNKTGNIKGGTGTAGSKWYTGTGITGTSTTAAIYADSGVDNAAVDDQYLNVDTGNTYKCTVKGAPSAAKWVYAGNIAGADAILVSVLSTNGNAFKNNTGSTTLVAQVYVGDQQKNVNENTGVVDGGLGTIKWYKGYPTDTQPTGFPKAAGKLEVLASDVANIQAYTCQLEG